jgi:hypothetical protein
VQKLWCCTKTNLAIQWELTENLAFALTYFRLFSQSGINFGENFGTKFCYSNFYGFGANFGVDAILIYYSFIDYVIQISLQALGFLYGH